MAQDAQLTPMMAQYRRIKHELPPGTLLLFRLGDFYEMFFEDAQVGAELLHLALTQRQGVPMCGLPYHAAGGYVARLLRSGCKIAICDQLEEPKPGKLVRREVTQILSPGAHFDDRMLSAERNNYLAAVCRAGRRYGLALVDLTTAEFRSTEFDSGLALAAELERTRPAEVLHPAGDRELIGILRGQVSSDGPDATGSPRTSFGGILNGYDDWVFAAETAQFTLRDHFKVASLDGFGLRDRMAAMGAAGAVLHYLVHQLRRDVAHLHRLCCPPAENHLVLDPPTLRQLEVLEPLQRDAPRERSLCGAIDRTVTPMGARRLRDWLSQPLAAVDPIRRRHAAVDAWLAASEVLDGFRAELREVRDLERTASRLSVGTGNARDLLVLRQALARMPALRAHLARLPSPREGAVADAPASLLPAPPADPRTPPDPGLVAELAGQLAAFPEIVDLLSRAIVDDPPLALKEGGLIREGYDPALDELRQAAREGKDWIARLQQQEIERTGIPSLKVRFNSVFGYYIEITRANLDRVPPDYIRKQTIANGERFFTPELKAMESRILGAQERSMKLEYDLFLQVREAVLGRLAAIQQTAQALGELDVLAGFAEMARLHRYCRPEVGDEGRLILREARHPILELVQAGERFVPNDAHLDPAAEQIALITGPNMAGKSTYIRQVALLVLLAHAGSFVPAEAARIDRVDRIFTRIGASDDLVRGQSTFMVEMSETANILNHATARSLIILDEIGRGTSTFDGLSLAWSIVEHLHHQVGAKTLFATHYHELTELAGRLPRVRNYNVAVREWNDQIVFLRRIVAGATDKSYGIQVARLAGVPRDVIDRAKIILRNLEESELTPEGNVRPPSRRQQDRERLKTLEPPPQLDLFRDAEPPPDGTACEDRPSS
ncbi:MAG TPA: DNA mismatch repair protein MutS [Verrucomicrobiota bacterium]|nr:DNA mismatch repair protein MutS [Verrucomicrobiota bacterium]HNU51603.1 DNA mismatch repair protein MutS [Verrucomicrobiota bacterium]